MFFLLAILSMLGYSLQGTLLVHHARKIDGLSLAVWRNLSLIFFMAPLLFFVQSRDYSRIPQFFPEILGTGISGAICVAFVFGSFKYLPAGISEAFRRGIVTILLLLLGMIFWQETISPLQGIFVIIILGGGTFLAFQKNPFPHLDTRSLRGVVQGIFSGVFGAISIFLMSKMARELNPYLAAYIWESVIALCALVLVLLRDKCTKFKFQKISWKEFQNIGWCSSPTLIGSGCSAVAVTLGPIGILHTIGAAGIFMTMILAYSLYKENLRLSQWALIALIVLGIAGLKIVS